MITINDTSASLPTKTRRQININNFTLTALTTKTLARDSNRTLNALHPSAFCCRMYLVLKSCVIFTELMMFCAVTCKN